MTNITSIIACAAFVANAAPASQQPLMANRGLEIPENQIEKTEQEALGGSGSSAFKLFDYYEIVSVDQDKSLYWATIAAENGYPNGMYALGFKLAEKKDRYSKLRARFWLEKAKQNGVAIADDVLKEMAGNTSTSEPH